MAVTIDIVESNDIHPKNKQDVGKLLALVALKNSYGRNISDKGPVFSSFEVRNGKIVIAFKNCEDGFVVKDKYGYIKGFEIAGEDKVFYYAKAELMDNKVWVYSVNVKNSRSVRFGWSDDAGQCNIFNKDGLPMQPFRTDNWPGITEKSKFEFDF